MSTAENYGGPPVEEPRADVRRYWAALNRGRFLIFVIVAVVTGAAVAISLALPKTYEAKATIVVDVENSALGVPDAESQQRRLATLDELIGSRRVLVSAAQQLRLPVAILEDTISANVDPQANLIDIEASDGNPRVAALMANTVARVFLTAQQAFERQRLDGAIAEVQNEIDRATATTADEQVLAPLFERMSTLRAQQAAAGSELQIAAPATPPKSPATPKPVRNGILALFASLFLGVLVALARDQLRPTISSPRELSRTTGYPVLAGIPLVGKRSARSRLVARAIEGDAYEKLAAELQFALPPEKTQVILVTSAVHGEGKTTVAERLGRVLAEGGNDTLLVTGDIRWPKLHEAFDIPAEPGLTDVLMPAQGKRREFKSELISSLHRIEVRTRDQRWAGRLCVLPPGRKPSNPAQLFTSSGLRELFGLLRASPFKYVLVDSPPALGIADVQGLAQEAGYLLWVCRMHRLTLAQVADMQDLLERLPIRAVGHVAIGAQVDVSPYYMSARSGPIDAELLKPAESRSARGS